MVVDIFLQDLAGHASAENEKRLVDDPLIHGDPVRAGLVPDCHGQIQGGGGVCHQLFLACDHSHEDSALFYMGNIHKMSPVIDSFLYLGQLWRFRRPDQSEEVTGRRRIPCDLFPQGLQVVEPPLRAQHLQKFHPAVCSIQFACLHQKVALHRHAAVSIHCRAHAYIGDGWIASPIHRR